jgi:hypothetical protein
MDAVVWLEEVGKDDLSIVGGKGASLGEMINIGVPVPGGFAVTAQAFRDFINRAGIAQKLFEVLNVDVNQESELHKAEKAAKKLIMDAKVPEDIEQAIKSRYEGFASAKESRYSLRYDPVLPPRICLMQALQASRRHTSTCAAQRMSSMPYASAGLLFTVPEPSSTESSRDSNMKRSTYLPLCKRWWTPRNRG